jgi:hypothetical protein
MVDLILLSDDNGGGCWWRSTMSRAVGRGGSKSRAMRKCGRGGEMEAEDSPRHPRAKG